MITSFKVKDNADGTGAAIYAVSSLAGTPTTTIARAQVAVGGVGSYANVGTIVAPATTTGTIAGTGYWSWRATDTDNVPVYVYQPATAEGDSLWERYLVMIADRIDSLNLPGLPSGVYYDIPSPGAPPFGVYVGTSPKLNLLPRPVIVCYTLGQSEEKSTEPQPMQTDDIIYPVFIEMIGPQQIDDLEVWRRRWSFYRERIDRAINEQRWDARAGTELLNVVHSPGIAVSVDLLKGIRTRVGSSTAKCLARMWRGTKKPTEP